jgi:hypothetical protein
MKKPRLQQINFLGRIGLIRNKKILPFSENGRIFYLASYMSIHLIALVGHALIESSTHFHS